MFGVIVLLFVLAVIILVYALGSFTVRLFGVRSRLVIAAAGPMANFLLAIFIFAGLYVFVGVHVNAPRVDELVPAGAAVRAGFKSGDVIISIDGKRISSFSEVQHIVSASAGRQLSFRVNRGDNHVMLKVTPDVREISDRFGNKLSVGVIGITRNVAQQEWEVKRYTLHEHACPLSYGAIASYVSANKELGHDANDTGRSVA